MIRTLLALQQELAVHSEDLASFVGMSSHSNGFAGKDYVHGIWHEIYLPLKR